VDVKEKNMFLTNNPFENYGSSKQALNEDPAHYAAIARNNARKQAERDKADPEAAKKRKEMQKKIDKMKPVKPADIGRHSSTFVGNRESVKSESFKYHIPEDIPANERTAFHGAAAAAAKQNKKSFEFGGKTHPVTMKKDLAKKIADQKENTMTFREKLMSLYEGDRAAHYKGATKPEEYDEKQKSSKGAMDMLKTPKSVEADGMKAAKDTADNIKKSAPGKKMRSTDKNVGDLAIKPSATPVKDPSAKMQTAESYGASGSAIPNSLLDAINQVTEKRQIRTNRVRGDRTMHDDHVKTGMGMGGEQTYSTVNKLDQRHYAKYISKKSGHDSYFDGNDLVHKKSSKTVVPNALISKKHSPNQLADKMKAHGDKHKGN